MKKIGIIDNVEFEARKSIYEALVVSSLSTVIVNDQSTQLKRVFPTYDKNRAYILGEIIEYDDKTNSIGYFSPFRKITEKEIADISYICKKYSEELNKVPNFLKSFKDFLEAKDKESAEKAFKKFNDLASICKTPEYLQLQLIVDTIKSQLESIITINYQERKRKK